MTSVELTRDNHSSSTHPDVPNKAGVTNWVERAGGLPGYIRRIAKHLMADAGMSTSQAIATAVNTVKRWARGGGNVTAATQAKAAKALAEWNAKKGLSLRDQVVLELGRRGYDPNQPRDSHGRWTDGPSSDRGEAVFQSIPKTKATGTQREALNLYADSGGFVGVNEGNLGDFSKTIKAAFKKQTPTKTDVVVHRGISDAVDIDSFVEDLKQNKKLRGFVSTTTDSAFAARIAGNRGLTMEIRVPTGSRVIKPGESERIYLDEDDWEREVLLDSGGTYSVVEDITRDGRRHLRLEYTPAPDMAQTKTSAKKTPAKKAPPAAPELKSADELREMSADELFKRYDKLTALMKRARSDIKLKLDAERDVIIDIFEERRSKNLSLRDRVALELAWRYDPNQPRWPKGSGDKSGQWRDVLGMADPSNPAKFPDPALMTSAGRAEHREALERANAQLTSGNSLEERVLARKRNQPSLRAIEAQRERVIVADEADLRQRRREQSAARIERALNAGTVRWNDRSPSGPRMRTGDSVGALNADKPSINGLASTAGVKGDREGNITHRGDGRPIGKVTKTFNGWVAEHLTEGVQPPERSKKAALARLVMAQNRATGNEEYNREIADDEGISAQTASVSAPNGGADIRGVTIGTEIVDGKFSMPDVQTGGGTTRQVKLGRKIPVRDLPPGVEVRKTDQKNSSGSDIEAIIRDGRVIGTINADTVTEYKSIPGTRLRESSGRDYTVFRGSMTTETRRSLNEGRDKTISFRETRVSSAASRQEAARDMVASIERNAPKDRAPAAKARAEAPQSDRGETGRPASVRELEDKLERGEGDTRELMRQLAEAVEREVEADRGPEIKKLPEPEPLNTPTTDSAPVVTAPQREAVQAATASEAMKAKTASSAYVSEGTVSPKQIAKMELAISRTQTAMENAESGGRRAIAQRMRDRLEAQREQLEDMRRRAQ